MQIQDLVAVARISRAQAPAGRFRITYDGDGLALLRPGSQVWLYHSPEGEPLLDPARKGLSPQGRITQLMLKTIKAQSRGGFVDLRVGSDQIPAEELVVGAWLCVPAAELTKRTDLYVFELRAMGVRQAKDGPDVGAVLGYIETGAHGVLVVEHPQHGELMIPFIDEFVEVNKAERWLLIPRLEEFVP